MRLRGAIIIAGMLGMAACSAPSTTPQTHDFPAAHRTVAPIISSRWAEERERDAMDEAETAMDLAAIRPGMTVADIGAGEGYYTVRLARRVGAQGRVLAQDIVPATRDNLARRVERERLDNVSVRLGTPDDPLLPAASFDRVVMMHMYHEIESPYAFLWNLRPSLKPAGMVIVVDIDRPISQHGIPPRLLACEFKAVGYHLVARRALPQKGVYLAAFKPVGARPSPDAIIPCVDEIPAP